MGVRRRGQGSLGTQDPQQQKSERAIKVSATRLGGRGRDLPIRNQPNVRATRQPRGRERPPCWAASRCRGWGACGMPRPGLSLMPQKDGLPW